MKMQFLFLIAASLMMSGCGPTDDREPISTTGRTPDSAADSPRFPSDGTAQGVQANQAWSAATPPGAPVGAGYLKLRNNTDVPDRVIAVSSSASKRVEIHETRVENEVMKMREIEGGLSLPPHQEVVLKPGGDHVMFIDLNARFVEGKTVEATLIFDNSPPLLVSFTVHPIGTTTVENSNFTKQNLARHATRDAEYVKW